MMELREKIARAICGNWIKGDDRPWQAWTEEADAVLEVFAKQEPVYLFRRKGFRDFCTCDKERYEELAQKPMFECKIAYSAPLYLAPYAQAVAPEKLPINGMYDAHHSYAAGWNDAIDAMLESAPKPEER